MLSPPNVALEILITSRLYLSNGLCVHMHLLIHVFFSAKLPSVSKVQKVALDLLRSRACRQNLSNCFSKAIKNFINVITISLALTTILQILTCILNRKCQVI